MSLTDTFRLNIRPQLDGIDRLRQLGVTDQGVNLPTIVVVGDQSSGKSSVLETLSGISLPRGTGIVTRVPLVLRLKAATPETSNITLEFGTDRIDCQDYEVPLMVEKATKKLAGDRKGITNAPIHLTVEREGAPDLTLVDLPGITRVPIDGQPEDIGKQVLALIKTYIEPEESVILNVVPATVDFATQESFKLSNDVDPEGARTLAVVTKVDVAGEDLYEKVVCSPVKVKLGYVLVRNRLGGETIDEARQTEKAFFTSSLGMDKIPSAMCGVDRLAFKLTEIQAERIQRTLPSIQQQIQAELRQKKSELESLPRPINGDMGAAASRLMGILHRREEVMKDLLGGENGGHAEDYHYAPTLHRHFVKFSKDLRSASSDFLSTPYHSKVSRILKTYQGVTLSNFHPNSALVRLLWDEVEQCYTTCENLVPEVSLRSEDAFQRRRVGLPMRGMSGQEYDAVGG